MVRISKVHDSEYNSMECLNLDDYNSDDYGEYLSDNMETTPTATTKQESTLPSQPVIVTVHLEDEPVAENLPSDPPVVTVTVQLEDEPMVEDLYE